MADLSRSRNPATTSAEASYDNSFINEMKKAQIR
jgi:hypothetical protein